MFVVLGPGYEAVPIYSVADLDGKEIMLRPSHAVLPRDVVARVEHVRKAAIKMSGDRVVQTDWWSLINFTLPDRLPVRGWVPAEQLKLVGADVAPRFI